MLSTNSCWGDVGQDAWGLSTVTPHKSYGAGKACDRLSQNPQSSSTKVPDDGDSMLSRHSPAKLDVMVD